MGGGGGGGGNGCISLVLFLSTLTVVHDLCRSRLVLLNQ